MSPLYTHVVSCCHRHMTQLPVELQPVKCKSIKHCCYCYMQRDWQNCYPSKTATLSTVRKTAHCCFTDQRSYHDQHEGAPVCQCGYSQAPHTTCQQSTGCRQALATRLGCAPGPASGLLPASAPLQCLPQPFGPAAASHSHSWGTANCPDTRSRNMLFRLHSSVNK